MGAHILFQTLLPFDSEIEKIAIFDLDRTLLQSNSALDFAIFLKGQRQFGLYSLFKSFSFYLLYRLSFLSLHQVHLKSMECFFKNKEYRALEFFSKLFWEKNLSRILCSDVTALWAELQAQGVLLCIATSAPDFLCFPVAHYLRANLLLSTRYLQDHEGTIIGHELLVDADLKKKALTQVQQAYPNAWFIGVGDSRDDLAFLKLCNEVYVVRPDRCLKEVSKLRSWKEIS